MNYRFFKCPSLIDLPQPPVGRHGWPWDKESDSLDPGLKVWSRISIIIPSFNQGQYIEEAIRSILLQGYPSLELHVIDGGSSDSTVDIIRKYEPWLSSWVSEKDGGQSEAINKGFDRCTGEIFYWLCSDDLLVAGSLVKVARLFAEDPKLDVVSGACKMQYDDEPSRNETVIVNDKMWQEVPYMAAIWQPSCFFRRRIVGRDKLVLEDHHYCMDRELWTYFWSRKAKWHWTNECLGIYRFTGDNKSLVGGQKIIDEIVLIYDHYFKKWASLAWLIRRLWLPLDRARAQDQKDAIRKLAKLGSFGVNAGLRLCFSRPHVRALQREFKFYSQALEKSG